MKSTLLEKLLSFKSQNHHKIAIFKRNKFIQCKSLSQNDSLPNLHNTSLNSRYTNQINSSLIESSSKNKKSQTLQFTKMGDNQSLYYDKKINYSSQKLPTKNLRTSVSNNFINQNYPNFNTELKAKESPFKLKKIKKMKQKQKESIKLQNKHLLTDIVQNTYNKFKLKKIKNCPSSPDEQEKKIIPTINSNIMNNSVQYFSFQDPVTQLTKNYPFKRVFIDKEYLNKILIDNLCSMDWISKKKYKNLHELYYKQNRKEN